MTGGQLRETAEEIDNTVLQRVTNRGLQPGYVRDLVLAAVNEALAEQEGEANAMRKWKDELQELLDAKEYILNRLRAALDEIEQANNGEANQADRCEIINSIIARTREVEK